MKELQQSMMKPFQWLLSLLFVVSMETMAASRFVSFENGNVLLTEGNVTIGYDVSDAKAVAIAAHTLAEDFGRVTGQQAQVVRCLPIAGKAGEIYNYTDRQTIGNCR